MSSIYNFTLYSEFIKNRFEMKSKKIIVRNDSSVEGFFEDNDGQLFKINIEQVKDVKQ